MLEGHVCKGVSVETVLYPNGMEVKSACDRQSSLWCEARLEKR